MPPFLAFSSCPSCLSCPSRASCPSRPSRLYCPVMADTTIPENALNAFLEALDKANVRAAELFPGDSPHRQPVHTVYGGAHLFTAETTRKFGAIALRALEDHAPDAAAFAGAFGID